MILAPPDFDLDFDYREQSPVEAKRRWRWKSIRRNELRLSFNMGVYAAFFDANGIERGRIEGDKFIIHRSYAWNGCSPKKWVPVFGWIGTPDYPDNLQASFWHDFLCQFRDTAHFPLSKEQVDQIFLEILRYRDFRWAGLYHGAVRDFGPMFKGPADGSYSVELACLAHS
jgi:hypothetical protein